jgi:hypothetical protein
MIVKPALTWIGANPDTLFLNNCGVVVLGITNNADIYATPAPGLLVVQAAVDAFSADLKASTDGDPSANGEKEEIAAGAGRPDATMGSLCDGGLHG